MVQAWFDSIWHFILSSASISTLVGIAATAVAVLMPSWLSAITDLRKWAIVVAVIAFAHTAVAAKFYKEGLDVKQAQWDAAVQAALNASNEARSAAERDISNGVRDPRDRPDN
jgi:hypothetical protein